MQSLSKGFKMNEIENLMNNGNWTNAISKFKQLNISHHDFQCELETENYNLLNWAILGYYTSKDT